MVLPADKGELDACTGLGPAQSASAASQLASGAAHQCASCLLLICYLIGPIYFTLHVLWVHGTRPVSAHCSGAIVTFSLHSLNQQVIQL